MTLLSKPPIFDLSDRTNWKGFTHQRRRKYRWLIGASHRLSFALARWFPKALPMVFVVGYPKSATTWASQLVADYLRLPFPQHSILPVGCSAVLQGHQSVSKSFPTAVYVVRDGRDVLISGFHHLRNQVDAGGGAKIHRRYFEGIDLDRPLVEHLPSFIEHCARHPVACKENWADHVRTYYDSKNDRVQIVKYEELLADPVAALTDLIQRLSGEDSVDEARIAEAVERYSFGRQTAKATAEDSETSYLRSGKSGGWRGKFDKASAQAFDKHFGDVLILAGYEVDSSWAEQFDG